jgi:metal-responsive CopG/Arc/MetJ family transcriptional regulator
MGKTLTVRLDSALDKTLTERARVQKTTRSALVRTLIDQGLQERAVGERIGHLKGRLHVASPKSGWKRRIKDHNWR